MKVFLLATTVSLICGAAAAQQVQPASSLAYPQQSLLTQGPLSQGVGNPNFPGKTPPVMPPASSYRAYAPPAQDYSFELGTRYVLSSGRDGYLLSDRRGDTPVSRLTWSGTTSNAGEIYGRVDSANGFFLKGAIGLSAPLSSGTLRDEDFVPFIFPGSATTSEQKNGQLNYGNIDAGYTWFRDRYASFGSFAGWQFVNETTSAYGCVQQESNPYVCQPSIPNNVLAITDVEHWNALRLGVEGRYLITDQLRLSGEAAFLPLVVLNGTDYHALRQSGDGNFSGSTPGFGQGVGVQLETKLDYAITNMWTVGVGARYWDMNAYGSSRFDLSAIPVGTYAPQVTSWNMQRYGAFLETALKF